MNQNNKAWREAKSINGTRQHDHNYRKEYFSMAFKDNLKQKKESFNLTGGKG
jgi:hypothetical protein